MSETIGFIGLGRLGLPMAQNLLAARGSLRVWNRTADKADPLVTRGATLVESPAATATTGGIVVSVVWDDAAVESIVTSPAFLERLGRGGIHVSMSTILPATAKRLAKLHAEHGSTYVEAPIFGRPEAAAAKQLWIPIAGEKAAKERVKPVLEAMGAQGIFDFGEEVGAANVVKIAGNFLIVSATRSLNEALTMAEKNGVDPKAVVHMLTTTLFNAPIYQSYGKMLAEKTAPPMSGGIPYKDLGLFMDTAEKHGAPTPLSAHLREMVKP